MCRLQRAGIDTAPLIAFAEECGACSEYFSCIITEAAGELSLDRFLDECRDRQLRAQVLAGLARTVWKMRQVGFASPDLFARHVFLDLHAGEPKFALIDMARLDHRRTLSNRLRARDLSSLNASIPLRMITFPRRGMREPGISHGFDGFWWHWPEYCPARGQRWSRTASGAGTSVLETLFSDEVVNAIVLNPMYARSLSRSSSCSCWLLGRMPTRSPVSMIFADGRKNDLDLEGNGIGDGSV